MHGAIAHLKEVDVAGNALAGGARWQQADVLSALAAAVELAAGDGTPDLAQAAASLQQCVEDTVAALNEALAG